MTEGQTDNGHDGGAGKDPEAVAKPAAPTTGAEAARRVAARNARQAAEFERLRAKGKLPPPRPEPM